MTPEEAANAAIAEFDAKYKRVDTNNVVLVGPEINSMEISEDFRNILTRMPRGTYRVAVVITPPTPDYEDDEDMDAFHERLNVAARNVGWVIPRGDERHDPEEMAVIFEPA